MNSLFIRDFGGRTWRRSGLTAMADNGCSGVLMADAVAHKDVKTTRQYVSSSFDNVSEDSNDDDDFPSWF